MTDYARHFIASHAAHLLPIHGQRLRNRLARQDLPYCFVETEGGLLALNRSYKPVGWPADLSGRVDYEDPQFDSMRLDLSPGWVSVYGLHRLSNDDGTFWFMYGGDVDPPWKSDLAAYAYVTRLCRVLGIQHATREGASP